MSQPGNVEVVRKPLQVAEHSSRTLEQRIALRVPWLAAAVARRISRLPPRARLRQAAVWRAARISAEAFNRRDLTALLGVHYHPEFEIRPAREVVEAGFAEPCYRGRAGYREWLATWLDVYGPDVRIEPVELIDLGERLVLLTEIRTRGQASGVPLTMNYATVLTLKDGRPFRDEQYLDYADALRAVGLNPVPGPP